MVIKNTFTRLAVTPVLALGLTVSTAAFAQTVDNGELPLQGEGLSPKPVPPPARAPLPPEIAIPEAHDREVVPYGTFDDSKQNNLAGLQLDIPPELKAFLPALRGAKLGNFNGLSFDQEGNPSDAATYFLLSNVDCIALKEIFEQERLAIQEHMTRSGGARDWEFLEKIANGIFEHGKAFIEKKSPLSTMDGVFSSDTQGIFDMRLELSCALGTFGTPL